MLRRYNSRSMHDLTGLVDAVQVFRKLPGKKLICAFGRNLTQSAAYHEDLQCRSRSADYDPMSAMSQDARPYPR